MTIKPWKRVEPTVVHQIGFRTIITKHFEEDGKDMGSWETILPEHQGMAAVIALTTDNQVLIVRQFRPGPEKIFEEIPGGFVDAGETPEAAVRRELSEETGYQPGTLTYLGVDYKDAYSNGAWHYFLATECLRRTPQHLSEREVLELDTISISQLFENSRHGKMTDAVAVYLAQDTLKKIQEKENA